MNPVTHIEGLAAPLPVGNLDTDQIMPKQFLLGIDKQGLARGLLYDMRFDGAGRPREDFVLNRPAFAGTRMLVAGPNFGCGSSREHAVWGLQQYGIQAVIAPSFGEIFYSNALNNGLLAAMVSPADAQGLMEDVSGEAPASLSIDVAAGTVTSGRRTARFELSPRHRSMLLQGLDMIGATLAMQPQVAAFAERHRRDRPWLADTAAKVRTRIDATGA